MEEIVKNNQSLIDVAIEHLGSAELAIDIALLNGISLTDALEPGTSLLLPETKTTTPEALPVAATVTEASLLQLLTAHSAIMGGAVSGHVRNGGNVTIDQNGRMWADIPQAGGGEKRHSYVAGISYCGTAPSGTAESSITWTLTKIVVSTSGTTTVTHATDSWANHINANYQ